jgi:hypothetical protein
MSKIPSDHAYAPQIMHMRHAHLCQVNVCLRDSKNKERPQLFEGHISRSRSIAKGIASQAFGFSLPAIRLCADALAGLAASRNAAVFSGA